MYQMVGTAFNIANNLNEFVCFYASGQVASFFTLVLSHVKNVILQKCYIFVAVGTNTSELTLTLYIEDTASNRLFTIPALAGEANYVMTGETFLTAGEKIAILMEGTAGGTASLRGLSGDVII